MLLRETIVTVLAAPAVTGRSSVEVPRLLLKSLRRAAGSALVLTGVRRCGKSTLQQQLRRQERGAAVFCNLEDTRLYGLGPEDFPTLLSVLAEHHPDASVFLDEVQEVPEWQRLVRALLDTGRDVCVTGSNASLLGRELGAKLTGRHLSTEVHPFSYGEYLSFGGRERGATTLGEYLDQGGFPGALREPAAGGLLLRELLRDLVQRDIVSRHGLRDTRHLMNLALHLLAHTGQPLSLQSLAKGLGIPSVAQAARYVALDRPEGCVGGYTFEQRVGDHVGRRIFGESEKDAGCARVGVRRAGAVEIRQENWRFVFCGCLRTLVDRLAAG